MKAEYIACSNTASKAIWIKRFLTNLNIEQITNRPIESMCDNQVIICSIKNDEFGLKEKYINHQYYYILIWFKRMNL